MERVKRFIREYVDEAKKNPLETAILTGATIVVLAQGIIIVRMGRAIISHRDFQDNIIAGIDFGCSFSIDHDSRTVFIQLPKES